MASWEDAALAPYLDLAKRRFEVRIPILDRFGEADGVVAVRVRFQNEREHWSPWSGLLIQPVGRVALPPENLSARMDAEGIHLGWALAAANFDGTHPAVADGVLVFRRELPQGAAEPAGRGRLPGGGAYRDRVPLRLPVRLRGGRLPPHRRRRRPRRPVPLDRGGHPRPLPPAGPGRRWPSSWRRAGSA